MGEKSFENFEKIRIEYNFEEGIEESIRRVEEMFRRQNYVVVGIAGPQVGDWDVGKTFLKSRISQRLKEKGIPVLSTDHIDSIETNLFSFKSSQDYYGMKDKGVIVLGALGFGYAKDGENKYNEALKDLEDKNLRRVSQRSNLPILKIDLRILIYRPDQGPLEEVDSPLADIVIKNNDAKIKNRKFS